MDKETTTFYTPPFDLWHAHAFTHTRGVKQSNINSMQRRRHNQEELRGRTRQMTNYIAIY